MEVDMVRSEIILRYTSEPKQCQIDRMALLLQTILIYEMRTLAAWMTHTGTYPWEMPVNRERNTVRVPEVLRVTSIGAVRHEITLRRKG